ncbi:MAG: SGNH/GDSL hydrolase family protein [Oscillospiraceae bacterium]|nr:SGNH/GDSL hydrolase family protein [Oscillospiraceae bacterium]
MIEGALPGEYYKEKIRHDVIFLGDCEIYSNISPITLYRQYGISSFLRATSSQTLWQSYYFLEEIFSYETPQIVVLSISAMTEGSAVSEAYNRLNFDNMRWSSSKYRSIKASMTEQETYLSYLLPLLRYHSRWSQLSSEDFSYYFSSPEVSHSGYLMRSDINPLDTLPAVRVLADYEFPDICFEYLDRIKQLCDSHGARLILMKAPSVYPHWHEQWDLQIREYADANNLFYYNFIELNDDIGIDMSTDSYDMGLHLNIYGAEKLSSYIGLILSVQYQLPDCRNDPYISVIYDKKIADYDLMFSEQKREWEADKSLSIDKKD